MRRHTEVQRAARSVHEETTRLKRGAPRLTPQRAELEERLSLLTLVMAKGEARELVNGLAGGARFRAREQVRRLAALDSASRQARVAAAFGARPDAPSRLELLLSCASAPLRHQLLEQLPGYLKSAFAPARPEGLDEASSPARRALTARLVWEAVR
jgi:hypothetical protein